MMRRSASEVLDAGDYLRDGFDFQTLTVPILRGILIYHNIKPSGTVKASLVNDCITKIGPRRAEFRSDRERVPINWTVHDSLSQGVSIHLFFKTFCRLNGRSAPAPTAVRVATQVLISEDPNSSFGKTR